MDDKGLDSFPFLAEILLPADGHVDEEHHAGVAFEERPEPGRIGSTFSSGTTVMIISRLSCSLDMKCASRTPRIADKQFDVARFPFVTPHSSKGLGDELFWINGLRLHLFEPTRTPIIQQQTRPYATTFHTCATGYSMENAIRNAIIKFEQEFMGRGPDDMRAFIVRDLVVARLKGVLTPAER